MNKNDCKYMKHKCELKISFSLFTIFITSKVTLIFIKNEYVVKG